jgi:predicted transcriptional regulator
MTELLEIALAAARELPPEMQDDIARIMLMFAGEDHPAVQLSAEEEASLAESLAQAASGEFATDEQVRAVWAKHGL